MLLEIELRIFSFIFPVPTEFSFFLGRDIFDCLSFSALFAPSSSVVMVISSVGMSGKKCSNLSLCFSLFLVPNSTLLWLRVVIKSNSLGFEFFFKFRDFALLLFRVYKLTAYNKYS